MAVNGFLVDNEVQKYNYESLENYNTPDFSTSSTYQVGDYVMYQGKLYKCITAITTGGAWDSTKWSLAILSDDVAGLKNTIGDLTDLETSDRTSIVAAINEVAQSGGGGIEVDEETDIAKSVPWEQGTIGSDGTPGPVMGTRVRNSDFIAIETGTKELRFEVLTGYRYSVYFYDESKNTITSTPYYDEWMTENWTLTNPEYAYFKVLLAKTDNGNIPPTNAPSNIKIVVVRAVPIDLDTLDDVIKTVEAQTSDEALTLTAENFDFRWEAGDIDLTNGGAISHRLSTVRRTGFIRVGKGSTVYHNGSYGYGMYVHMYDSDKAYIGNSGTSYVRTYYVPQDGYIRIQIRANDASTIAEDEASVSIIRKLPEGFVKYLVGNGELPSYYDEPINIAIAATKADMITAGMTGDTFIFFSDVHWPDNFGMTWMIVDRIMQEIPALRNVINGGDTINGILDADESISAFMGHLPKHGILFNLVGNHDTYVSNNRIYAELLKQFEYAVVTGGIGYYYFDNLATKTRYICLNTKGQGDSIDQTQLAWFNSTLASMPDGFNALVFAHILYNFESDWHDAAITTQGAQIANACDTFNANNVNKKVFAIFGGHVHADLNFTTAGGIPMVMIDNNGLNTWGPNTATSGTITESALDIVTVDYANKSIKCERIGRGGSRTITVN